MLSRSAGAIAGAARASEVPLWLCLPFVGMLLSIAIMPLVCERWWEEHRFAVVIGWCALLFIPFGMVAGVPETFEIALECLFDDYLTFIVLLFGLFCVSGNISLEGDLAGSPRVNVGLMLFGTLLASVIGTTGASMLMIRPIIKMNSWRWRKRHIIIFFIFMISNMGGALTPIGDPPLLMGFMRGVPFTWSLRLAPILLTNVLVLLIVFYKVDMRAYRRDIASGRRPDIRHPGKTIEIHGLHNLIFIAMIVAAVISSGVMPSMPAFRDADGNTIGIRVFEDAVLTAPSLIEVAIILTAALLSFRTTDASIRRANHFTWGAIEEVAELFIGIFFTMQPALMILKSAGPSLGITSTPAMFWTTGLLSSFLDNTPTYLVFLTAAGALGATEGVATTVGTISVKMLTAISCGAVFMGACTYIGNAPNFMVKTIANENGIQMPSFFAYIVWAICILIPVFALDTVLFFM